MAALSVDLVVVQSAGNEVVATACLDTIGGIVSEVDGLLDDSVPGEAWIEVRGGSEMFFKVRSAGDNKKYQVVDMEAFERFREQIDCLTDTAHSGCRRG